MADELVELGHHAMTAGGTIGIMLGALKWFGGRQVKQMDDTLASMNAGITSMNVNMNAMITKMAVMEEQLKNLLIERAETVKTAGELALLKQEVRALHERVDRMTAKKRA
mgnify:CR=1 FL=1